MNAPLRFTTDKAQTKMRGIAERAYSRGNNTCHISVLALMATLDELAALTARLETAERERDELLKSDAENVDEFNAGFDAYKSGLELDSAEEFYRACKREEGVPSYDSFSTGYAWAKFVTERAAALKAGQA